VDPVIPGFTRTRGRVGVRPIRRRRLRVRAEPLAGPMVRVGARAAAGVASEFGNYSTVALLGWQSHST
jgi:hypothetical protein